jgi:hypothetical protein
MYCQGGARGAGSLARGAGLERSGKSKGPRRALALCDMLEAVLNLSDALGFGGLELAEQILDLPSVFTLGAGLKFRDDRFDLADPEVNADVDLSDVCV